MSALREYVGDGSTLRWTAPDEYISEAYIKCRIGGVDTPYTWSGTYPGDIQVTIAPAVGTQVLVYRETPVEPLVDFQSNTALLDEQLDTAILQALHLGEEGRGDRDYYESLAQTAGVGAATATEQAVIAANQKDIALTASVAAQEARNAILGVETEATTLPAGSLATASFDAGQSTILFGIPQGDVGPTGPQGPAGADAVPYTLPQRLGTTLNLTTPVTDWNTVSETGLYRGLDATNAPPFNNWAIVYAVCYNDLQQVQTAMRMAGGSISDTKQYRRYLNNGTWSAWFPVYDSAPEIRSAMAGWDYVSTETTISTQTKHVFTHGLGSAPTKVSFDLICKTADGGFAVGDILTNYSNGTGYASNHGLSVGRETGGAEVFVTLGAYIGSVNPSTGLSNYLNPNSWKIIMRASL